MSTKLSWIKFAWNPDYIRWSHACVCVCVGEAKNDETKTSTVSQTLNVHAFNKQFACYRFYSVWKWKKKSHNINSHQIFLNIAIIDINLHIVCLLIL